MDTHSGVPGTVVDYGKNLTTLWQGFCRVHYVSLRKLLFSLLISSTKTVAVEL